MFLQIADAANDHRTDRTAGLRSRRHQTAVETIRDLGSRDEDDRAARDTVNLSQLGRPINVHSVH